MSPETVKKKDVEINYDFFMSTCLELSKFQGYDMDPEHTTVLKYCLCLKKLNKHVEQLNRQIEKQHGSGNH